MSVGLPLPRMAEVLEYEGQGRFRSLWERSPVGALAFTPEGVITFVNQAFCDLVGYRREELLGRPFAMFIAPDEFAVAQGGMQQLATGWARSDHLDLERTYRRKDGTTFRGFANLAILRDEQSAATSVVANVVPIPEDLAGVAGEHWDDERRVLADDLLESIELGILGCDENGRPTLFQGASRRWLGLADADADAAGAHEGYRFIDGDGVTPLTAENGPLLRALHEGSISGVEVVLAPDGRPPVRVLCSGHRVVGPGDESLGAVVNMQAISEIESRPLTVNDGIGFRALLHSAPLATAVLDEHGQLLEANDAFCRLVEQSEEELIEAADPLGLATCQEGSLADLVARALGTRSNALQLERSIWTSSGVRLRALIALSPLAGRPRDVLLQIQELGAGRAVVAELVRDVVEDPVTRLPTVYLLSDRLQQALARRENDERAQLALLSVGVDRFIASDEQKLYAVDNQLLAAVAERLLSCVRGQDTICRVEGGTFVVLCADLDTIGAPAGIAAQMEEQLDVLFDEYGLPPECRTPVAVTFATADAGVEDLIRRAGNAVDLYSHRTARTG